jgi:hypothetical protein
MSDNSASKIKRYSYTCAENIHDLAAQQADQVGLPLSNIIAMLLANWTLGKITIELDTPMLAALDMFRKDGNK